MKFRWTDENEELALKLKGNGIPYRAIAKALGTTSSSVKHKVQRLQKAQNSVQYHHPEEKAAQAEKILEEMNNRRLYILETHCGFGGMSEVYSRYGRVTSYDIVAERAEQVDKLDKVCARCEDSEEHLFTLLYLCYKFDVIDIDPYGFPSRFFPHVFKLMDDGVLFLTFPVMGAAQLNKITIRHYKAFWNIELSDKKEYLAKVLDKLQDYAFMEKRSLELLNVIKLDSVYRMAFKVKKESLLKIVGLEVNRTRHEPVTEQQQQLAL